MFAWTTEKVFAAIDAGIREVISTYNSSYIFAIRDGYTLKMAHTIAMSMTLIWLRDIERENAAEKLSTFNLVDAMETFMAYEHNASNSYIDAADRFAAACEAADDAMNPANW